MSFWNRLQGKDDQRSADLIAFLDALPDYAMILDRESRVTFINQALGKAWPLGDCLIGQCIWDALPDLAYGNAAKNCRDALADGKARSYSTYSRTSQRWYTARAVPVDDSLIVLFWEDTSRAQINEALRTDR